MKNLLIIWLFLFIYPVVFANEACRNIDHIASKKLNNQVYEILMKPYKNIHSDLNKLIYINTISNKVSDLHNRYTSDFSRCTISWISYRLEGNKQSLARKLQNIDQKELESAPTEIQSLIEASKNSIF